MKRALLVFLVACTPELDDRESLVDDPRVLAIRAEPAEAKPGTPVTYTALVAGPEGPITTPLEWAYCSSPKPLTENNSVSSACLEGAGTSSETFTAPIPGDACALFGPDPPPGGFRPRDPDVTGGYYQPLRARTGTQTAFLLQRVRCNLASAPVEIASAYAQTYRENQNPKLLPLALAPVKAGAAVRFEIGWEPPEVYAYFDPETQSLRERREAMRVSWFATAGSFESDRTGRGEVEPETSTSNAWTAPSSPGRVHLWVVLRDSRGGTDFAGYVVEVVP
jgi:hypothetical protein